MTTEHEPQGEERSLVIQNTSGTDLATSESSRMLRAVHFSNEFPARVMKVNQAFKSIAPVVDAISITLIPGIAPRIDAGTEYGLGYVVNIKSSRWGTAQLDIKALDELDESKLQWGVYIEQLQAFIADAAPDKKARIHAEHKSGFGDKIQPLDMPIPEVTQEVLEEISKDYEIEYCEGNVYKVDGLYERGSFEVILEGEDNSISSMYSMFRLLLKPAYLTKDNRPFFKVLEMHYSGNTSQVESVMDKVVNHLFFPASPKESPETQG